RDATVTGVQTCALPIYSTPSEVSVHRCDGGGAQTKHTYWAARGCTDHRTDCFTDLRPWRSGALGRRRDKSLAKAHVVAFAELLRSEERRVGKRWRCWVE